MEGAILGCNGIETRNSVGFVLSEFFLIHVIPFAIYLVSQSTRCSIFGTLSATLSVLFAILTR